MPDMRTFWGETMSYEVIPGFIYHPLSKPNDKGKSPGKKPLLEDWQNLTATPPDIDKYIAQGCNLGIVCGRVSNVTVLDFDHFLFLEQVFNGFDLETLRSKRTEGRGHVYFKYNPNLPASKHHVLGIEVLSDGSNAVVPPSVHASGDVYTWSGPCAPIIEMPKALEDNLKKLFQTETELKQIIAKCRHCFRDIIKRKPDMHGAEGREYMLAVCADLKAKDATESHIMMFARIMYVEDYKEAETLEEWKNIDRSKTWTCDKLREKLPAYVDLTQCDKCEERREKYKEFKEGKKKEIKAPLELPPIPHEAIDQAPYDLNNHLTTFKKWLAIKEDYNIIAPLCAFIGNFVPGESDIVGIIAPSGSTKTEILRSFGEHENQYSYPISSMTEHTLVSGHEDNIDTIPILRHRVMLIKDLTSVLAKKEDVRSGIFADFRDITDGHIRKEFGNGIKKEYLNIHSSILFASTNAIERYYTMYSNLGQRMVFVRPHNDPKEARIQSEKNRYSLDQMRKELHDSTMRIIYNALKNTNEKGASNIPEDAKEEIGTLCDFLALIRTSIHHDIKGDIDEIPEPEFPTRVYNTVCKLTEVHASLNGRLTANEDDKMFAFRIIVDNIPTIRLQMLQHITVEEQTTAQISKKAELPTPTGKRVLDDLTALHMVVKIPRDMKGEFSDDKRSDSFFISDDVATTLDQLRGVIRRGYIVNNQLTQYNKVILKKSNILDNNVLTQCNSQCNSIPLESHPSIFCNTVTEAPASVDFNINTVTELTQQLMTYGDFYQQQYGQINSLNLTGFCLDFVKLNKPKAPDGSIYNPSSIKGIAAKIFKITPEPGV